MPRFVSARPHWWQWFTILSLDAVSVSLTWQWWFARGLHVHSRPPEIIVLGASVWLAYTADRWIEAVRLPTIELQTQRHRFAARWRWPIMIVWLIFFAADVTLAFTGLSARELETGFLLLAAVAAYLLSHQLYHRHHPGRLPKEICVAVLITAGALLFPALTSGGALISLVLVALHFLALCLVNCLLISRWERDIDVAQGQQSLALEPQLRHAFRLVPVLPWLLALESGALALRPPSNGFADLLWSHHFFLSIAMSAALLGVVDRREKHTGWQPARVLADVVLLTPLLFW